MCMVPADAGHSRGHLLVRSALGSDEETQAALRPAVHDADVRVLDGVAAHFRPSLDFRLSRRWVGGAPFRGTQEHATVSWAADSETGHQHAQATRTSSRSRARLAIGV